MMPDFVYLNSPDGSQIALNINHVVSIVHCPNTRYVKIKDTSGTEYDHITDGYEVDEVDREGIAADTVGEFARFIGDREANSDSIYDPYRQKVNAFLFEGERIPVDVNGEINTYE